MIARQQSDSAFEWVKAPWGEALVCGPLAAVAPHLFTTRQLQLRGTPDETAPHWTAVGCALGVERSAITRVQQVHGTSVAVVRAGGARSSEGLPARADALITDDPTVALSVVVADCVPILIADRHRGVVSAVHAGWRGTCASMAIAAVKALQQHFGSDPAHLVAAVGPSIGPCCYEVGVDVREAFAANGFPPDQVQRWFATEASPASSGRIRLDLWSANRDQLVHAGVPGEQIHLSRLCTVTAADRFFSYRREGDAAGRMAAVIRMKA